MNTACRIFVDPAPNRGTWNMAVDECLLHSALAEGLCAVRTYEWSEPTLSLGYFQDPSALMNSPEFSRLPQVRRLSGGGAILHHHELTYSCVIPVGHPLAHNPQLLYQSVHKQVISLLSRFEIEARFRGEPEAQNDDPFLCFGRGDPRDVLMTHHKILGSAQRRRRGAVLQHGSLLLKSSPHAPQFPGVFDLAPESQLGRQFNQQVALEISEILGTPQFSTTLNDELRQQAETLEIERYRSLDWRGIP